jgi:CRP-like cAMP-binding protein
VTNPPRDPLGDTGSAVRTVYERHFRAGEVVFEEGQPSETLFVIQTGSVELVRQGPEGERLVARHGPGELIGEISVLLGQPRTSRAIATTEARLLQLDRGTFESMCVDRPEIALRVIQRLAERAIDLEKRLAALGVDDLLRPVVRVLLRHAPPGERSARIETSLRKIANEAGLRMNEAHRALNQLLDQKLVRLVDDVLEVRDFEALAGVLDPGE